MGVNRKVDGQIFSLTILQSCYILYTRSIGFNELSRVANLYILHSVCNNVLVYGIGDDPFAVDLAGKMATTWSKLKAVR